MDSRHKASILYLDAEQTCRDVFRRTFGDEYDVRTAASAEEARRELHARPFDIVLSDQSTSGVSGAAFLREAAATQPASYRMMLTGEASVREMLKELGHGFVNGFVTKPWRVDDMRQAFERAFMNAGGRLDRLCLVSCAGK
jgi:two-component system, NtrC family, response regulator HupR/HoxA